ncbi:unnamed protein product, partial [Rotaria sp. Silwood2]
PSLIKIYLITGADLGSVTSTDSSDASTISA